MVKDLFGLEFNCMPSCEQMLQVVMPQAGDDPKKQKLHNSLLRAMFRVSQKQKHCVQPSLWDVASHLYNLGHLLAQVKGGPKRDGYNTWVVSMAT